ncbi:MAG: hypothetical protein EOP04_21440, partial [Proteobacteria bacterium]
STLFAKTGKQKWGFSFDANENLVQIVDADGNSIGKVTSGTQAPSLNKGIGLGYVTTDSATAGSEIFIRIRNKDVKAQVVKLPFYKPE